MLGRKRVRVTERELLLERELLIEREKEREEREREREREREERESIEIKGRETTRETWKDCACKRGRMIDRENDRLTE